MSNSTIAQGKEELAQGLRHLVDEADQLLSSAARNGDKHLEAARDELARQVRHMRAQLEDLEETALRKARRTVQAVDDSAHAHPYAAMGLAAAAGLLIGFLAARR